ncbi:hypothetical protein ACFYOG_09910 [Streptomyces sp. NPDC007818]|uniref:hypothetical protein n=1 Tax=Streptomyces sp. NPDC007818 TaxID=3364780 RepID=UPI00369CE350
MTADPIPDSGPPSPEFDLPPQASPALLAAWDELADRVCRELARAGLPARRGDREGGPLAGPGADVHVDRVGDGSGGVYVDWATHDDLRGAVVELLSRGVDFTDPPPLVRHHAAVHAHMRDALLGILGSAGFEVEGTDPHTFGCALRVTG